MSKTIDMKKYGLSEYFINLANSFDGMTIARIISQGKGRYSIVTSEGEKYAKVSGKFRYNTITVSEYPAVGDFVMVDRNDSGENAVIHSVLPRKSCFIRKAAGESRNEQIVATNIDTVFICMSLNNDFNLRRLERYISIAWESGAMPVIVLTKADLCNNLDSKVLEVSAIAMGVDILVTTSTDLSGYESVFDYVKKGMTTAFIGSSGVGKSTLINCLLGEKRLDTNGLRNDDRGRHTTTHRELIILPNGGMVVDTPGMREIGMWDSTDGIDRTFSDIEALSKKCRFNNCTHSNEPHCAILSALNEGVLSVERWQSYKKLKAENSYIEDSKSYLAIKEHKFKEISKYNKSNRKR